MGSLDNRVALITGAARGQGRSHAIRLAEEGCDIIASDICTNIDTTPYELATEDDLAETVRQVEALDRRIVARTADVRSSAALEALVSTGISEFGRLDIVLTNAGITNFAKSWEMPEEQWQDLLDVNLTGTWRTIRAAVPGMIERGNGGAIVLTGSTSSFWGTANASHYVAAKHGVWGLTKALANELAEHKIRVNAVIPTTVDTDMIQNEAAYRLFSPELEHPTRETFAEKCKEMQSLDIPWVEAIDVSHAVEYLVSDRARYVTGMALQVDGGMLAK